MKIINKWLSNYKKIITIFLYKTLFTINSV